jgi:creatinine amidohydrolase/Fe(II)-dependent formamide hydrolase-like protein
MRAMRSRHAAMCLLALWWTVTAAAAGAQERPQAGDGQASPDRNAPRPVEARDTVWMEELTWMEVRDSIRGGKTTAIVPTGGIEQNGPYTATGKHNFVLQATSEAIARRLGDALVAPIVKFVPEGGIDPPSGHMQYPGTISLREETFVALLTDIVSSLKQHGFRDIVLIGDSGGNRRGMQATADALNAGWKGSGVRVHHVREYYETDMWSFDYLKEIGIKQEPDVKSASRAGIHDDYHYESIVATVDPRHIRVKERQARGLFSINGVDMNPPEKTIENGKKLVEYRARLTAEAIRMVIGR